MYKHCHVSFLMFWAYFFLNLIVSASASGLRFGVVPFCFKGGGDLKGIKKGLPMGNPFFVVIVLCKNYLLVFLPIMLIGVHTETYKK